ncbi:MAG: hypothetical protein ACI9Y1_001988, partial [Lentisphaeria bacterium]
KNDTNFHGKCSSNKVYGSMFCDSVSIYAVINYCLVDN